MTKFFLLLLGLFVAFGLGVVAAVLHAPSKHDIIAEYHSNASNVDSNCAPSDSERSLSFERFLKEKPADRSAVMSKKLPKPVVSPNSAKPNVQSKLLQPVTSIASLRQYLNDIDMENYDLTLAIDYINSSDAAIRLVMSMFRTSSDPDKKSILMDIIASTENVEKIVFAQELLHSASVVERKAAYIWLADSDESAGTNDSLINATYFEQDKNALTDLVHAISSIPEESNSYESAITRLSELSYHENPEVASSAISAFSGIVQNEETLSMLKLHLNNPSQEVKRASLNGLFYLDAAANDEGLRSRLEQLASSQSEAQDTRELAQELLLNMENTEN